MKKIISLSVLLITLLIAPSAFATPMAFEVKPESIENGYIIEQITLKSFAMPKISLSGISYINASLPAGAVTGDPLRFQSQIGMDRKRPFLVVRIPAYVTATGGAVAQVSSFVLDITEAPAAARVAAKTTDVTTSALASGTWYKIAVIKTGFYKIDNSFITSLGVDPSTVNPANIRVLGNGGNMLSEANSVARPADLVENALLVTGGGTSFTAASSAIFYGVGTVAWNKDSVNKRFVHSNNLYADSAYYFISFDSGPGLRIGAAGTTPTGTVQTVTDFNYRDAHEKDLISPALIGKYWYGETFGPGGSTQSFDFDFGATVSSIYCTVAFGYQQDAAVSHVNILVNNTSSGNLLLGTVTDASTNIMAYNSTSFNAACNATTANISLAYSPSDGTALAYLDYVELNCRRPLTMTADQMSFRDWNSVGTGNVASYQLQGATGSTQVWDVTDPQVATIMDGSLSGTTYSFTQDAAALHEFAAMNSANLYAPAYVEKVVNQNLHGSGQVDCIIVTSPTFLDEANKLAEFHHDHDSLRVVVATTSQIYNEFSSGGQDISAIRDFERMFYKRAGTDTTQMPRYMILYGGASVDYKNRLPANSNFVPVYESSKSFDEDNYFCGDDFYGLLDDNEDINANTLNILDIAVGRLPARSTADADVLLSKIEGYNTAATLGPWRIASTFVADKECLGPNSYDNAGYHMRDAEAMAQEVAATGNNIYNEEKIYVDAIPVVSTPAGPRCPNANAALDNQIFKGTFLVNYNGHGNPTVWSTDRILTKDDFNNWNNANSLPFMVTATCDFGQFDQPSFVSAAEQLVLRNGGGVIAVMTTTQAVYSSPNHDLNIHYLASQFTPQALKKYRSMGDAFRSGKNVTYATMTDPDGLLNYHKFSMLGDPVLVPDFPRYNVTVDSLVDGFTQLRADSVKALGAYIITGSVRDDAGNILTDFNGLASVSFYDKPRTVVTIDGCDESFSIQDNIIYKGRATVTNGIFSVSFITPKDINYVNGTGKISAYAQNDVTDGAGSDTSYTVGGFSDHPVTSTNPPLVKAYINDSLFLNGGITGSNTSLFVSLFDQTGINVSGNDVGHDMTAVLDGNTEAPYLLNDYYASSPNTYQRGYVTFPLAGLATGHHTITVRAWDVNNNVGEGTVDFIVIDGSVVDIQNLGNYPNPFTNTTNFVFEHNHPEEALDVQIEIYSVSGALVKNINQSIASTGSRTNEISWDGTDINGNKLPSGVYVYRLNISTEKGFKSSAYQKLVIVR